MGKNIQSQKMKTRIFRAIDDVLFKVGEASAREITAYISDMPLGTTGISVARITQYLSIKRRLRQVKYRLIRKDGCKTGLWSKKGSG